MKEWEQTEYQREYQKTYPLSCNRAFSQYTESKMSIKIPKWDLCVVNRKDLECDWDFVTEQMIKEKCKCVSKSFCFQILRLLKDGNYPEAEEAVANKK